MISNLFIGAYSSIIHVKMDVLSLVQPQLDSPENNPTEVSNKVQLSRPIELPASSLNEEWESKLKSKLESLVGSLYNGGEILSVDLDSAKFGDSICTGRGLVYFDADFTAEVYHPTEGDVIDIEVFQVNNYGFFGRSGPAQVFVPKDFLNEWLKYDLATNSYLDEEGIIKIHNGSQVRVKITAIRSSTERIHMIGTTQEDYLGVLTIY